MANRTREQRLNHQAQIAELYLQGRYQAEIAREIGISQQQVSYDLAILRRQWVERAAGATDTWFAEELARIDKLERTYWQAWERSTAGRETRATSQRGDTRSAQIRTEDAFGDPRFLSGVQWCIDRRCKLLRLDPPARIAPTNPEGDREYRPGEPELTDQQRLERLAELLERGRAGGSGPDSGDGGL